jgi:hypothetical protein
VAFIDIFVTYYLKILSVSSHRNSVVPVGGGLSINTRSRSNSTAGDDGGLFWYWNNLVLDLMCLFFRESLGESASVL